MTTNRSPEEVARALRELEAMAKQAELNKQVAPPPHHKKLTLAEFVAQQQAATQGKAPTIEVPTDAALVAAVQAHPIGHLHWNEEQELAITMARQGKSFCLIGAAGTGKTTTMKGCVQAKQVNNLLLPLEVGTKYLAKGAQGIAFVSYTRRAVRQLSRQLPEDLRRHALTIHKLLEYAPVKYEYTKPDGKIGTTMRFEPQRNIFNPLPRNLTTVVIDESSMVSTDLFEKLKEALPRNVQFIFLGDLHQLPPVYGEAVLANKLQELPVVELTHVYRQALDSPIITLATKLRNGEDIPVPTGKKTVTTSPDGKSNVIIYPWPGQYDAEDATMYLGNFIKPLIQKNQFNEEEDVILMPHNVNCGTIELNLVIANELAIKRGAVVHHVIAGYEHWYLAVGDRVLVDKQDCVIRGIERNPKYVGKSPLEPSPTLDRWGTYQDEVTHHHLETSDEDIDKMLESMAASDVEDKKNEASHVLILESLDTGAEYRVGEVGIYNNMVFSWALTVHKSQGSEWRRVFLLLHKNHHAMCSRELLYTAVTRAREELIIICEPDRRDSKGTLWKASKSPRIQGNTLAEKLEWLRSKSKEKMDQPLLK